MEVDEHRGGEGASLIGRPARARRRTFSLIGLLSRSHAVPCTEWQSSTYSALRRPSLGLWNLEQIE